MSGIVLSSSVRQNLLSLQSTADLLATTQNRLATGKKVNTALDNPTNFFTASSLDNRASDINNLLDGIGNGVQVLQAANTGITSLQKLVDSAKSVANQTLQAAVGYSTKSSVSTAAISGATASDLRGVNGAATNATVAGTAQNNNHLGAYIAPSVTGSAIPGAAGGATLLSALTTPPTAGDTITIDADTYTITGAGGLSDATHISIDDTLTSVLTKLGGSAGGSATLNAGAISITGNTGASLTISGTGTILADLGLTAGTTARTNAAPTPAAITGATLLSGTATPSSDALSSAFTTADTIVINGTTINFTAAGSGLQDATNVRIDDSITALLAKIDAITGATVPSAVTAGQVTLSTGTAADLVISGSGLAKLGLSAGTTARTAGTGGLNGQTLNIAATGDGVATAITFGDGTAGTVKSLNDLNAKLATNNLQATISATGVINITTTNDAASETIGAITGTAAATGAAFNGLVGAAPVQDAAAQLVRSNLVAQYNNILDQITTTAQDASYNGINLLNGDQLKLTFNETGTSTLNIQGVTFNAIGLGLSKLTAGTDFLDNTSANDAISTLSTASSALRTQASTLGSNLSIVQIRQDFSKNLINVLQTGSSNLTLADTNEEAANSQALSTRQSIAVSALALANQSQQSVLQLLR
jgi:flagellin